MHKALYDHEYIVTAVIFYKLRHLCQDMKIYKEVGILPKVGSTKDFIVGNGPDVFLKKLFCSFKPL